MRADLLLKDQAFREGFDIPTPRNVGEPLSFTKGPHVVWQCTHEGKVRWACATIVPDPRGPSYGTYARHAYYDELRDALDDASARP